MMQGGDVFCSDFHFASMHIIFPAVHTAQVWREVFLHTEWGTTAAVGHDGPH